MNYVKNAWYVAAWSQDLAAGQLSAMEIIGHALVIWRDENGDLSALDDRCPHRHAPLSLGRCTGANLQCMYHGFVIDRDGAVVSIPGQDMIPEAARVRSYPVVEKHSWIWVWMGDAERADEALIPPAVGFDDPNYILGRGHLDYAAEARLISDNLCDFSHLTYVHAASFGATDVWAKNPMKITPLERGVRFERWVCNDPGPSGRGESGELYDVYSTYDYLLPGILLMWGGSFPLGYAERCGHGVPASFDDAVKAVTFTSQAVTPMSDKTSRYFFSWGPHVRHGDENLRDQLMVIAGQAFGEDKVMIEAQQRVIDRSPDSRIIPTVHDRGVILFNRLVDRLAAEEREAGLA